MICLKDSRSYLGFATVWCLEKSDPNIFSQMVVFHGDLSHKIPIPETSPTKQIQVSKGVLMLPMGKVWSFLFGLPGQSHYSSPTYTWRWEIRAWHPETKLVQTITSRWFQPIHSEDTSHTSQIESFPHVRFKIKNVSNHHLEYDCHSSIRSNKNFCEVHPMIRKDLRVKAPLALIILILRCSRHCAPAIGLILKCSRHCALRWPDFEVLTPVCSRL